MNTTLIVHPKDNSTAFLDIVYKDIPNQTLITGGISKTELKELIKEHDRVMMMGHGSPYGLFSVGQFKNEDWKYGSGYIIDQEMVSLLEEKEHNVYIWCWASSFVEKFNLKGFSSGMFISEVAEANAMKVYGTDQDIVDESNYGFVNIVNKFITEDSVTIYNNVIKEYGLIAEQNPVAFYNHNRIRLFS
jgi:hypothetical protein